MRRLAEPFERLREAVDRHLARTGQRPQIFLAALGEPAVHSGRTTWMKNFLAAGGIEAVPSAPLHNSADAGKAFADSLTRAVAICSSDAVYAELAEATAGVLKAAGAAHEEAAFVEQPPFAHQVRLQRPAIWGNPTATG